MKKSCSLAFFACCALMLPLAVCAQTAVQTFHLNKGWNAFYLEVDPSGDKKDPAVFFRGLPVGQVGRFVQGASAATAQYAADGTRINGTSPDFLVWLPSAPYLSTLTEITGGAVYTAYATNATSFTCEGIPCLPAFHWRDTTLSGTPYNIAAVALDDNDTPTLQAYFREGPPGPVPEAYSIGGTNPAAYQYLPQGPGYTANVGEAFVLNAASAGSWPGVLDVRPGTPSGLILEGTGGIGNLTIVNAGTTARTVRVSLRASAAGSDLLPALLRYSPPTATDTDAWVPFGTDAPVTNRLAPGDEWTLRFAADPINQPAATATATNLAALLCAADVDGGTRMRVLVPLRVLPDSPTNAYPAGLWIGEVALSQVNRGRGEATDFEPTPTPLRFTVILHVDTNRVPTLLQRVVVATTNAASPFGDNAPAPRLYTDMASVPDGWTGRRISSLVIGLDNVRVPASPSAATFGDTATFAFDIAERASDNPFRHAWHPDHDGLDATFATNAPSGDVPANFLGEIKPEAFTISNTVSFVWSDIDGNSTFAPNPDQGTWGRCDWTLSGLRADGPIRMRGTFLLHRILPYPLEPR